MIILEGTDNTGKTTLAQDLVARFHHLGLYMVKSPGSGPTLGDWIIKELKKNDQAAIYDRFFFSEYVYGPVLRGKVCYTRTQDPEMVRLMCKAQPVVIWCSRPPERIAVSFDEREQMEGVVDNLKQIEEKYQQVMLGYLYLLRYFVKYDYEQPSNLKNVCMVIQKYFLDRLGFSANFEVYNSRSTSP